MGLGVLGVQEVELQRTPVQPCGLERSKKKGTRCVRQMIPWAELQQQQTLGGDRGISSISFSICKMDIKTEVRQLGEGHCLHWGYTQSERPPWPASDDTIALYQGNRKDGGGHWKIRGLERGREKEMG